MSNEPTTDAATENAELRRKIDDLEEKMYADQGTIRELNRQIEELCVEEQAASDAALAASAYLRAARDVRDGGSERFGEERRRTREALERAVAVFDEDEKRKALCVPILQQSGPNEILRAVRPSLG